MDGRLAVLFWLMSLTSGEYQGDGFTVQRGDIGGHVTASAGRVEFQDEYTGYEARLTYSLDKLWRFNPIIDASLTDKGGVWVGLGLYQQFDVSLGNTDLFAGLTFAPGYYMNGDDVDLGGPLEFRSGLEIGVRLENDWQVSVSYDHRSNADLGYTNPGLETLQLRFSHKLF